MSERYHQVVVTAYEVGDQVSMAFSRTAWEVWRERIGTRRWNVERTKRVWFVCTSTSPGGIWPQVVD